MPLVERDGKFFCPTCGEELPKGYKLITDEENQELCDYCVSNPKYNKLLAHNYRVR
jgi:uncharacterized Zn finger protein (UPF0148 family)